MSVFHHGLEAREMEQSEQRGATPSGEEHLNHFPRPAPINDREVEHSATEGSLELNGPRVTPEALPETLPENSTTTMEAPSDAEIPLQCSDQSTFVGNMMGHLECTDDVSKSWAINPNHVSSPVAPHGSHCSMSDDKITNEEVLSEVRHTDEPSVELEQAVATGANAGHADAAPPSPSTRVFYEKLQRSTVLRNYAKPLEDADVTPEAILENPTNAMAGILQVDGHLPLMVAQAASVSPCFHLFDRIALHAPELYVTMTDNSRAPVLEALVQTQPIIDATFKFDIAIKQSPNVANLVKALNKRRGGYTMLPHLVGTSGAFNVAIEASPQWRSERALMRAYPECDQKLAEFIATFWCRVDAERGVVSSREANEMQQISEALDKLALPVAASCGEEHVSTSSAWTIEGSTFEPDHIETRHDEPSVSEAIAPLAGERAYLKQSSAHSAEVTIYMDEFGLTRDEVEQYIHECNSSDVETIWNLLNTKRRWDAQVARIQETLRSGAPEVDVIVRALVNSNGVVNRATLELMQSATAARNSGPSSPPLMDSTSSSSLPSTSSGSPTDAALAPCGASLGTLQSTPASPQPANSAPTEQSDSQEAPASVVFSSLELTLYMKEFGLTLDEVRQFIGECNSSDKRSVWSFLRTKRRWDVQIEEIQQFLGSITPEVDVIVHALENNNGMVNVATYELLQSMPAATRSGASCPPVMDASRSLPSPSGAASITYECPGAALASSSASPLPSGTVTQQHEKCFIESTLHKGYHNFSYGGSQGQSLLVVNHLTSTERDLTSRANDVNMAGVHSASCDQTRLRPMESIDASLGEGESGYRSTIRGDTTFDMMQLGNEATREVASAPRAVTDVSRHRVDVARNVCPTRGLANIGNSCYFNSALQLLFCVYGSTFMHLPPNALGRLVRHVRGEGEGIARSDLNNLLSGLLRAVQNLSPEAREKFAAYRQSDSSSAAIHILMLIEVESLRLPLPYCFTSVPLETSGVEQWAAFCVEHKCLFTQAQCGQLKTEIFCSCGASGFAPPAYSGFSSLSIPASTKDLHNIQHAVDMWGMGGVLIGDAQHKVCPHCKTTGEWRQRRSISRFPATKVLLVTINREYHDKYGRARKWDDGVMLPATVRFPAEKGAVFDVEPVATCIHSGSGVEGGHYYCTVAGKDGGSVTADDSWVTSSRTPITSTVHGSFFAFYLLDEQQLGTQPRR